MGACISTPEGNEVTEQDRMLHREAEKQLREVRLKLFFIPVASHRWLRYLTHTLTLRLSRQKLRWHLRSR